MNQEMKQAWLEISRMLGEPTREELDVFLRTWQRAMEAQKRPAQQEPVALKWQQAPVKTQWGDEMVVASVAIDKDHTVCLYCERDQAPKVEAMFAQRPWVGLTDEEVEEVWKRVEASDFRDCVHPFAQAIEAALRSKNENRN